MWLCFLCVNDLSFLKMGKAKTSARSIARAEARKTNKSGNGSEKKSSFSFVGPVGIVFFVGVALVAGFYLSREMKKNNNNNDQQGKRVFGMEENVDFSIIPDVFVVDVCRFHLCHKMEVKKSEGFQKAFQQIHHLQELKTNNFILVNQTGSQIISLSGLFSASEEKGKERGLGETWRGVKVLVDDEKFFWPLPKNASDFDEIYTHFMSDGHKGNYFFFFFFFLVFFFFFFFCIFFLSISLSLYF